MDYGLIMFLKSSKRLEQEDLDIIFGYRIKKVFCVVYEYTIDVLDELESRLDEMGYRVDFIMTDGRKDPDLYSKIKIADTANADRTFIDVTFASPYHSALVMNLGGSEKVEIGYSDYAKDGTVVTQRLDRIRNVYNGLAPSCYLALDCMTREPQSSAEIFARVQRIPLPEGEKDRSRSKSSIYEALDFLSSIGLIERYTGPLVEKVKTRTPNYYRFSIDQEWDYFSYKRIDLKRQKEISKARSDKKEHKRLSVELKSVGADRRRKNERKNQ